MCLHRDQGHQLLSTWDQASHQEAKKDQAKLQAQAKMVLRAKLQGGAKLPQAKLQHQAMHEQAMLHQEDLHKVPTKFHPAKQDQV
jgi:hypothetical protein